MNKKQVFLMLISINSIAFSMKLQEFSGQLPVKLTHLDQMLLNSANEGNLSEIKTLLASGADVNTTDGYGYTPLMIASEKGQLDIVEYLISINANLNAASNFNYGANTALMLASKKGNFDVVQALLRAGADTNLVDKHKQTALMLAKENGHKDVELAILISSLKALQNLKPQTQYFKKGLEALILELMVKLVMLTPSINTQASMPTTNVAYDEFGHTLVTRAVSRANYYVDPKNFGRDDRDQNLFKNAKLQLDQAIQKSLTAINDNKDLINTPNKYGKTPLMIAANNHNLVDVAKALVELGADINAVNQRDGNTALINAINSHNLELVEWLLTKYSTTIKSDIKK